MNTEKFSVRFSGVALSIGTLLNAKTGLASLLAHFVSLLVCELDRQLENVLLRQLSMRFSYKLPSSRRRNVPD